MTIFQLLLKALLTKFSNPPPPIGKATDSTQTETQKVVRGSLAGDAVKK